DVDRVEFLRPNGWKAGIGTAGRNRAARHDFPERLGRLDVTDAAAEFAAFVEGDERSPGLREDLGGAWHVSRCASDKRNDGFTRDSQQELAIVIGGHDAPLRRGRHGGSGLTTII